VLWHVVKPYDTTQPTACVDHRLLCVAQGLDDGLQLTDLCVDVKSRVSVCVCLREGEGVVCVVIWVLHACMLMRVRLLYARTCLSIGGVCMCVHVCACECVCYRLICIAQGLNDAPQLTDSYVGP
jgi:hypothetical protein